MQVYDRLQKLGISMSYKSTVRLLKDIGKDHDHNVVAWRDQLINETTYVSLNPFSL